MKNKAIQAAKVFAEGLSEAFREALPEAFAKAMPNPEQEQEQEQEIKDSGRAKRDRRKTAERLMDTQQRTGPGMPAAAGFRLLCRGTLMAHSPANKQDKRR